MANEVVKLGISGLERLVDTYESKLSEWKQSNSTFKQATASFLMSEIDTNKYAAVLYEAAKEFIANNKLNRLNMTNAAVFHGTSLIWLQFPKEVQEEIVRQYNDVHGTKLSLSGTGTMIYDAYGKQTRCFGKLATYVTLGGILGSLLPPVRDAFGHIDAAKTSAQILFGLISGEVASIFSMIDKDYDYEGSLPGHLAYYAGKAITSTVNAGVKAVKYLASPLTKLIEPKPLPIEDQSKQ